MFHIILTINSAYFPKQHKEEPTCLREPATNLYPEPDESNRHPSILFPLRCILILSPLGPGVPNDLLFSDPPTKTVYALLFLLSVLHALPLSLSFDHSDNIWWEIQMIFSGLFLHLPMRSKYSPQHPVPSGPSQSLIFPLMWETKIHNHTSQQAKLHVREVAESGPLMRWPSFWSCLLRQSSIFGAVSEASVQMKRRLGSLRACIDMSWDSRGEDAGFGTER
jgi:hypothetical protein